MRKKLWVAMLALAVVLGLITATALADVMENIQVSGIQYYPSGCLKGFTMTYTVGQGLAAADVRVSVQTVQFKESVSGYQYGDFRDNGRYARTHRYPTWPDTPDDCGFVAWNGDTFRRPASGVRTSPLEIHFADGQINCNAGQTYYLYVWANYNRNTYPDAYVMQFTTGGGSIAVSTGEPAAAPTQGSTATPAVKPTNMPKTGDRSSLALWVTLGLLSGCSILALARREKKDR